MLFNIGNLQDDELLVYERIIKPGRTQFTYEMIYNMSTTVGRVREILRDIFGKKMITRSRRNTRTYFIRDMEKIRAQNMLPCMRHISEISFCAHHKNCYLAIKCPAAQRQIEAAERIVQSYLDKSNNIRRIDDNCIQTASARAI